MVTLRAVKEASAVYPGHRNIKVCGNCSHYVWYMEKGIVDRHRGECDYWRNLRKEVEESEDCSYDDLPIPAFDNVHALAHHAKTDCTKFVSSREYDNHKVREDGRFR